MLIGPDTPGSQLFVGPNIKLRGVEISDCDVLIVEGHVEATVNSKAMQIAKPGTLKGVVVIDVAEIDGEFSGELTAHAKLIVRGTGRVSGKIRYGRLIVADGGELSGDVQRIEPVKSEQAKTAVGAPVVAGHASALSPQPLGLNPRKRAAVAVRAMRRPPSSSSHEPVADRGFRDEVLGLRRVVLDLLPQDGPCARARSARARRRPVPTPRAGSGDASGPARRS